MHAVYHGYEISEEGIYCRRRLALRPETQRARRIGNFVARLHHPRITVPDHRSAVLSLLYLARGLIPYEYAKRLHGDDRAESGAWLKHCINVLRDPLEAAEFAWHMLRDRKLAARKFPSIIVRSKANLYSVDFHAEQLPDPASRVLLDHTLDALGTPRLRIDWRYTDGDVDTVRRALALLAAEFSRTGVGNLDYSPEAVEAEMTRYGAYGGHHIGTARMGADPRTSVVNPDCRVHDVENLFIASAATFPTSSQANPTLTVVAMALRLAAHLRAQLGRRARRIAATDAASVRGCGSASGVGPGDVMRVMVLGADGFIGGHLIRSLAASDWATPVAAGRRPTARADDGSIERVQVDGTNEPALRRACNGVDAVVSCISGSADVIAVGAEGAVRCSRTASHAATSGIP